MPYSQTDYKAAFQGLNQQNQDLPYKLVKEIVLEMRSFLLGDGHQKKLKLLAVDAAQQETLNTRLDEINLYQTLFDAYIDVLTYGESYIDYSTGVLRHIRTERVSEVKVEADNPLKIVYLKESREFYNATSNNYENVQVVHSLQLPIDNQQPIDLLNLPTYKYAYQAGAAPIVPTNRDSIPILRLVNSLSGRASLSPIESVIHAQLEYNDLRRRIDLNGRHHKPLLYTIGTSAAAILGRTNAARPEAIDTPTGSAAFQTSFNNDAATMVHLPISQAAMEAGIVPKLGYLQPVDSTYLERQRLMILQDIYNLTGVMVLELQNARSASSSSSLSVLYEPLKRSTQSRASYLISNLKTLLTELGIQIPFRVELPDMMPRDLQDKKLQIEAVKNKLISRKRYLIEVEGLSEQEAEKELEQLDQEKGLNIQYSAALVDSTDAPNTDSNTSPVLTQSAIN